MLVQDADAESDEEPALRPKGRQRLEWEVLAADEVLEGETLRQAAQRWLKAKLVCHKTLTKSSNSGEFTLIARCKACSACTKKWCFSQKAARLVVETVGSCTEEKDVACLKRHLSRTYARDYTPARALKKMREEGVPLEHRPSAVQIKNKRPKQAAKDAASGIRCLGDLRRFVSSPPADVHVYAEHAVCEAERVLVPFSLKQPVEDQMRNLSLECFLLDWTFNTNASGLLLGAVGPVGLHSQQNCCSMRFMPVLFVLASSEDEPAQHLAVRLYYEAADRLGVKVAHGFFDCSCFYGVASFAASESRAINIRRCLQHAPWALVCISQSK